MSWPQESQAVLSTVFHWPHRSLPLLQWPSTPAPCSGLTKRLNWQKLEMPCGGGGAIKVGDECVPAPSCPTLLSATWPPAGSPLDLWGCSRAESHVCLFWEHRGLMGHTALMHPVHR